MSVMYIRDKDGNLVPVKSIQGEKGEQGDPGDSNLLVVTVSSGLYTSSHSVKEILDHVANGGAAVCFDSSEDSSGYESSIMPGRQYFFSGSGIENAIEYAVFTTVYPSTSSLIVARIVIGFDPDYDSNSFVTKKQGKINWDTALTLTSG